MIGIGIGIPGSSLSAGGSVDYNAAIAAKIGNGDAWTLDEAELTYTFTGVVNGVVLTDYNEDTAVPTGLLGNARQPTTGASDIGCADQGVAAPATSALSVVLWISPSTTLDLTSGAQPIVLANDTRTLLGVEQTQGAGTAYIVATCDTVEGSSQSTSAYLVSDSGFQHVAVVRTAAGFSLYINGALAESVAVTSGHTYVGGTGDYMDCCMGTQHIPTGRSCLPPIDEVLVAHGALTADEVAWLYNGGAGRSMMVFA
ncbi:MAG: hypothetical protein KBF58_10885 [Methyloversatilis sp.]|nr:hypothetical protein [Methyloversatilis sp.]